MEMSGEQQIAAPRQKVWEALNDPEVLKQAIPGCQSIEKTADNEFTAKVKAKVGPVNATFSGKVTLSDLNPPESYTISGEGAGGTAGFAKGGAKVRLEDQGESTKLIYDVDAQVGGKLAQLGQRLIKSTANKYATQFFETFRGVVEEGEAAAAQSAAEAPAETAEAETAGAAEPAAPKESAEAAPAAAAAPTGGGDGKAEAKEREARAAAQPATERGPGGLSPAVWIGGAIVVVIVLLALFAF